MSDTASQVQPTQPTPVSGEGAEVRADGSSSSSQKAGRPLSDQPTIITSHAPTPAPATSDSTCRILEGRVMPGDRLGQFELVEYVGGGGMGRVFRAIDTQLGRTVALKILPPEQASDPDALQRFQNEAQSAARLDHDNIARAFYVGEDRGLHYIVFEFIDGVNIRVLVERKGPLPLAEAISYTLQVAEALAHADARSVVHRDIKPSNVLITPEGRAKLIDMGLARLRQTDPALVDLTASGVTLGTFDYISPEQARDPRNADIRSDIYSLGCTFFFMLAGQPPFPEGTVLQKLLQHQGDEPPNIQEFRPELPEESSRVLRKMMAKDPRHRYAGAADLVADLLLLAEEIGLRPMSPTSRIWLVPREPPVSFLHRHLPWIIPVAALVCIVLVLDRLLWSSSAQREDQLPPPSAGVGEPSAKQPVAALSDSHRQPSDRLSKGSSGSDTGGKSKAGKPQKKEGGAAAPAAATTVGPTKAKETPPPAMAVDKGGNRPEAHATGQAPSAGLASASPATSPDKAAPKRSGLLIVSEKPEGEDQFSTLAAACAVARTGDVIELRYNGPREDRPIKISNVHVTIRGGGGYQPIVVFRPSDIDPVKYPRSMFTLAGGQLTLVGVAMELHVPREVPADNWSLFETCGGEMVRLEQCSLTMQNSSDQGSSYHQDVAFFRARLGPDSEAGVGNAPAATPLATLELADCIARGEADLLHVEDLQPVHLTWDNGLLITTERLLTAAGSQAAPKLDEMLRIELRHVTAAMRGGICRLTNTSSDPYQLTVQFVSTDSILIVPPGVPLVEQEGIASVENFRQRFIWNGDRNYYQDSDVFWRVRNFDSEIPPDVMGFEAWKAYWGPSRENQPSMERLLWKKATHADQPLHAQGPADYTLEDPTFGDASTGAPGCQVNRLPSLPPSAASPGSGQSKSVRGAGVPWRMN